MAFQYSQAVVNARLDTIESTIGASPKLRLYSGGMPANAAAAATGTLLADVALPADWMNAASGGNKTKLGSWSGTGAAAASTGTNVGYFRITDTAGTTCHIQGTVTVTGGGGDMTLDNISIANGQAFSVSTFTITGANQ